MAPRAGPAREPRARPLFGAVLAATGVTAGTRLLEVGCGSGLLLNLAHQRGVATGLDVAPGLLAAAHDCVPSAARWLADLQRLPFPNGLIGWRRVPSSAWRAAGPPRYRRVRPCLRSKIIG